MNSKNYLSIEALVSRDRLISVFKSILDDNQLYNSTAKVKSNTSYVIRGRYSEDSASLINLLEGKVAVDVNVIGYHMTSIDYGILDDR